MDLGFTWFDFAALVVLGLSGVMAFARGLIREMFSVIAFIGAAIAGYYCAGLLAPFVESVTPLSGWLAAVAAGLLVFLIVFVVITVIVSSVAKQAHQSTEIGSFDRAAGLAFGVLRGVLVVSLLVLVIRNTPTSDNGTPSNPVQDDIRGARTYPIYDSVAGALAVILPRAGERARDIIDRRESESAPIPPAETETQAPQAPPT